MEESVIRAAERHLAASPRKVLIGTSYECRAQNRQSGAKLSEHAFANALNVMGFEFVNRRSISVTARWDESPEAMFLSIIRAHACEHFTTVLGPGSETHLKLFLDAYNHARRLKTLRGLTPYEHVLQVWTKEPERFKLVHHITYRDHTASRGGCHAHI